MTGVRHAYTCGVERPGVHVVHVVGHRFTEVVMPSLKVSAVQRDIEGLLKLLGGSAEDRLRFWEIVKGITTPAQFKVASKQLEKMQAQIGQAKAIAKELKATAGKVAKG